MHRPLLVLSLACLTCLGACSSSTPTTSDPRVDSGVAPPADAATEAATEEDASTEGVTHVVEVSNFAYSLDELSIKVGDTVEWKWTEGTHTVSSGVNCTADKKIESGRHSTPFTFRHTFATAGRFDYFCDYMEHCAKGQTGFVDVVAR